MKRFLFLFPLSFMLLSCLPDEPTFDAFRRVEVQRLLSNQETKRWMLDERMLFSEEVAFDSCEVPRQVIFNFTSATSDKDSLFYINPADTCGISTDTLRGFWFVPSAQTAQTAIDTVVFVWRGTDTAYFQIEDIDPNRFSINTFFEADSLFERFTHFPFPPVVEDEDEDEEEDEEESNQ
ncbi:hypothetical protein [Marivirga harenae]|uniref:hypothetical protein n=1 Tax=Marivirga harenae TaxID=2010992 RepID=UPI0026DF8623|nr:hypothetical protein [Marivirga harenae]WKV11600.1 hypothetical protein Q3Y49_15460 [Marivirga harenae]